MLSKTSEKEANYLPSFYEFVQSLLGAQDEDPTTPTRALGFFSSSLLSKAIDVSSRIRKALPRISCTRRLHLGSKLKPITELAQVHLIAHLPIRPRQLTKYLHHLQLPLRKMEVPKHRIRRPLLRLLPLNALYCHQPHLIEHLVCRSHLRRKRTSNRTLYWTRLVKTQRGARQTCRCCSAAQCRCCTTPTVARFQCCRLYQFPLHVEAAENNADRAEPSSRRTGAVPNATAGENNSAPFQAPSSVRDSEAANCGDLFPGRPLLHQRVVFKNSKTEGWREESAKEDRNSPSHSPGLFTVQCACEHPKLLGVSV